MDARDAQALLLQVLDHYRGGALDSAASGCLDVLRALPAHVEALNLLGLVRLQQNRAADAVDAFRQAIAGRPDNAGFHSNLGMALRAMRRLDDALAAYERSIELQPGYAPAHVNRGNTLMDLRRFPEALAAYEAALDLRPNHPGTLLHRGMALQRLDRHTEAIADFDRALAARPDDAATLEQRGKSLSKLGRMAEAIVDFSHALEIAPDAEFLLGVLLTEKAKICDWQDFDALKAQLEVVAMEGAPASPPFGSLLLSDDPTVQLKAAVTWVARYGHPVPAPTWDPPAGDRIRLGFFSADLTAPHVMMQLMAGMLAQLDRQRFHLTAFSFMERGDADERIIAALFDEFVPVSRMSDEQVAALSRQKAIDIAIDLQAYTRGMRPRIFLSRAAPVQVNYLAYPGTTGSPAIDYIIADPTLIPPDLTQHYSERIAYLPGSYQPRAAAEIGGAPGDRVAHGLPDDGAVFCCFNNAFKISPGDFQSWMRILDRVSGSVLWLLHDVDDAIANLRRSAGKAGIDPARLVFAARAPLPVHLARQRLADLFLDTSPYNAHTTTSDALLAGLPVLTRVGTTFAGRVAASILNANGLPELVTSTTAAYEDEAVRLATDPEALAALKQKVRRNARTHSFFDIAAYTRNLEALFEQMHRRRLAGLPAADIRLNAETMA
jgi:predicted O-linked N-acetylglucosamine transferase (SPINDLY family)